MDHQCGRTVRKEDCANLSLWSYSLSWNGRRIMSGYNNTCVAYILVLQLLSCPISTMCGVVDSERHYCYSSSTYTTYIYTDDQSVDTFAMELIHICFRLFPLWSITKSFACALRERHQCVNWQFRPESRKFIWNKVIIFLTSFAPIHP